MHTDVTRYGTDYRITEHCARSAIVCPSRSPSMDNEKVSHQQTRRPTTRHIIIISRFVVVEVCLDKNSQCIHDGNEKEFTNFSFVSGNHVYGQAKTIVAMRNAPPIDNERRSAPTASEWRTFGFQGTIREKRENLLFRF